MLLMLTRVTSNYEVSKSAFLLVRIVVCCRIVGSPIRVLFIVFSLELSVCEEHPIKLDPIVWVCSLHCFMIFIIFMDMSSNSIIHLQESDCQRVMLHQTPL